MSVLAFICLFVGCNGDPTSDVTNTSANRDSKTTTTNKNSATATPSLKSGPRSFVGMKFVLQSVDGYELVDPDVSLGFSADSPTLFLNAGCNNHNGSYKMNKSVIYLTNGFIITKMWCGEELDKQEKWFANFLGSSPTLTHDFHKLTLTSGSVTLRFMDEEVAKSLPHLLNE